MKKHALAIDLKHYEDIVGSITNLAQDSFRNLNISKDVANSVLISLLKGPPSADSAVSQTQAIYPRIIEELFASYHKLAFNFCLQRTQNPELSNDIAQETICCLLKSPNPIDDITHWIKRVAHNLLFEHYRAKKSEQALYRDLYSEAKLIHQLCSNAGKISLEEYLHKIPESIFDSQNYKSYLKLKAYDSLKAYAEASGIGYETAKNRSRRIVKDLKAEILLAMGWQASPEILNYNQYRAIQSFIRKLLALIKVAGEEANETLSKLHPELPKVLSGYKSIEDWGITMISTLRFRLYLFHLSPEQGPLASTLFITLNKQNHVDVKDCKRNVFAGEYSIPANVQIPKEKGRIIWPYEKIISLLNEKSS